MVPRFAGQFRRVRGAEQGTKRLRCGGLPETLGKAGFLFDIPNCYTPRTRLVPTPEEVSPWVTTILRLWDDPTFYLQEQARSSKAAEAWRAERLLPQYERLLLDAVQLSSHRSGPLSSL